MQFCSKESLRRLCMMTHHLHFLLFLGFYTLRILKYRGIIRIRWQSYIGAAGKFALKKCFFAKHYELVVNSS